MTRVTRPLRLTALRPTSEGQNGQDRPKPGSTGPLGPDLTPFQRLLVEPTTIEATGLPLFFLSHLTLKLLYFGGVMEAWQIASALCLRFNGVVEVVLDDLKRLNLVEVKGGNHLNPASYQYALTERGAHQANEALTRNRYVGPCPVTLEHYIDVVKAQAARRPQVDEADVTRAVQDLILSPEIIECIGPAVNSFRDFQNLNSSKV